MRSFVLVGSLILLFWGGYAPESSAQTIIDRYQQTRQIQLLDRLYPASRLQPAIPKSYQRVPTALDSLYAPKKAPEPEPDVFPIDEIRTAHRFERSWLKETFADTQWSFLGPQPQRTLFDTTRTVDLRAQMQAHFGAPTYVIADDLEPNREDFDQFAYWFVVNDSIPVVITDANGPRDRGIIIATERRWRNVLPEVRDIVLAPLHETKDRDPYVDYYYDRVDRRWYRVGYDGDSFFMEHVARRTLTPGRRPPAPTP